MIKIRMIKKYGFTLIELLVVISIIGILATLALSSYSGAQKQARDTQRKSDLQQYRNVLETYAFANGGNYPVPTSPATSLNLDEQCATIFANFMSKCPSDPTTANEYVYLYDSTNTRYLIYADIETAGYWYICSNGKVDKADAVPTVALCN